MPPPRRGARRRKAAAAAAAAKSPRATRASRRLSVRHGEPSFKRESRGGAAAAAAAAEEGDDDGLPLNDESLLLVFSALAATTTTADLVRCAATCRRWGRLVSADAAFICRHAPPDPSVRNLALGFFHSRSAAAAAPPRFVPLTAAASRLQASFAAVVGGASRVVASRNGRLVLDLRRRANSRVTHAVRLGVCNPVTGSGVDVLPALRGKDSPTGPYACTVITAADEHGSSHRQHSSYRVLLLYNRRSFTALRCYSSDAGSWGPEAVMTGARIGRKQLAGGPHAAVVHHGVVFWPRFAVAVRLDSLSQPASAAAKKTGKEQPRPRHTVAGFSHRPSSQAMAAERLLGVMQDGRMLRVEADSETIRAYWGGDAGDGEGDIASGAWLRGERLEWRWTVKLALMRVHTVRLRWLCEKNAIVIFTARNGHDPDTHVYTVDVEAMQFMRVRVATSGEPSSLGEMCGYEMDRVTLLPCSAAGEVM